MVCINTGLIFLLATIDENKDHLDAIALVFAIGAILLVLVLIKAYSEKK